MTIEEFVKEAITGIVRGVAGASEELKGTGAVINPATVLNSNVYGEGFSASSYRKRVQKVELSVVLTAESSQGRSGSFGLSVAGVSANIPGKEKTELI